MGCLNFTDNLHSKNSWDVLSRTITVWMYLEKSQSECFLGLSEKYFCSDMEDLTGL